MTSTSDALVVRMEATLAKFERQMARGRKVGRDTAVGLERQFANSNRKISNSAEQSAMVIRREMDRLKAKYDPVFAASKRYEAEVDELTRAHRLGAISAKQYEATLETLNATYTRGATQPAKMASGMKGVTAVLGRSRFAIQNVSFQVADFATQIGSGTSAAVSLGQQLPQVLGTFGAIGAVLGAVAAIGIPVAAALFNMGQGSEELEERMKALEAAVEDYNRAAQTALLPTADLAKKYGTATEAARTFLRALSDIAQVTALQALNEEINNVAASFGSFDRTRQRRGSEYAKTVRTIRDELDISATRARSFAEALETLGNADGPQQQADAARDLLSTLEEVLGPFEEMNEDAQALYENIAQAGQNAAQLAGASEGAGAALGGAASQAGRLADELGRAVENAINLAAQGIADVRRAQIEYDFRNDPVGRAGALARERFDSQTNLPAGADSTIQNVTEQQRREYVAAAEEAERYRQALIKTRKAEAETSKGARSGGGSSRRDQQPLFGASDKQILRLERQIELIGKAAPEVAELEAKWRLLDEAKERGLNVDQRSIATGETLLDGIKRQAKEIGTLTRRYDHARERAQFFDDIQQDLRRGTIDAIVESNNLSDALGNLAKSLAKASLEAALFGTGPLSGGQGGGLLGPLFGGIFGGFRADGGPVSSGKSYVVGERGPELFVPKTSGAIVPNGAASGSITLTVQESPSFASTVDVRADQVAVRRVQQYDVASQRRMKGRVNSIVTTGDTRAR